MNSLEFPGSAKLVETIDAAMAEGSIRGIADCLRNSLSSLIQSNEVKLPACVLETIQGHYARRELYQSNEYGYCVVAMTWGPRQGTAIHDHCGMWCVEGVWQGALEVVQYERLSDQDGLYRFQPVGSILASAGSAGSLIPPHEYHTIRNPSENATAVSVHVYAGRLDNCAVFRPKGAELCYERCDRQLGLDPIPDSPEASRQIAE
jgi:3-mercaptopropionate dioxygenase